MYVLPDDASREAWGERGGRDAYRSREDDRGTQLKRPPSSRRRAAPRPGAVARLLSRVGGRGAPGTTSLLQTTERPATRWRSSRGRMRADCLHTDCHIADELSTVFSPIRRCGRAASGGRRLGGPSRRRRPLLGAVDEWERDSSHARLDLKVTLVAVSTTGRTATCQVSPSATVRAELVAGDELPIRADPAEDGGSAGSSRGVLSRRSDSSTATAASAETNMSGSARRTRNGNNSAGSPLKVPLSVAEFLNATAASPARSAAASSAVAPTTSTTSTGTTGAVSIPPPCLTGGRTGDRCRPQRRRRGH